MKLSHLRPMIALPAYFFGIVMVWCSSALWECHVQNVNTVGKNLTEWARQHHLSVRINGKPVNRRVNFGSALLVDGNCRNISITTFQEAAPTGPYTPDWKNLSAAIRWCDLSALKLPLPDKMRSKTPEQLAEDLQSLGKIEFVPIDKIE
jgi:hypothetical protein